MLRRVKQYIADQCLLQSSDRVLVCVSGGADSIALLDVLLRAGYDCVVAHCNFHLRGEESNRDENFVRTVVPQMAASLPHGAKEIPVYVRDFDTIEYAKSHGISIEMAARDLRYAWFDDLAEQTGCQAIAVAHHQNDQAETVLLNLRRGTGIRGLAGMRPRNGKIIRPLLCTTHDYICHYLRDIRHLDWVEDSTNADTAIRRNAIRQEMSTYTKAEIEHIAATAEYIQGYIDLLEHKDTPAAHKIEEYETLRNTGSPS